MLIKTGRIPSEEKEYIRLAKALYWQQDHENERLKNAVEAGVIEALNKIFR